MKLISRNTDYAAQAICYIAKKDDSVVSVAELVNALKIPRPFLRKILQILNKKGILKSHKGACGGFRLARRPGAVYLVDLIEAFQGPFKLNECLFRKEACPNRRTCVLKKKIDSIGDRVYSELKDISIESIIKNG